MRLALVVPAVVAALILPATASAQTPPPDERAAAQAFADAAKRFAAATAGLQDPDTSWLDPCEKVLKRVPEKRQMDAFVLVMSHSLLVTFGELREPLRAFRTELANVGTSDPVLISGRAAVRQMGRRIDSVPAPGRFCTELRAWRRAGYPHSAMRAAARKLETAATAITRGIQRKIAATAMRLRELGVSRKDAEAFGGEAGW